MSFQAENCDDTRTLKALVSEVRPNDKRSLRTPRRHSITSGSFVRSERTIENRSLIEKRVESTQTQKGRINCGNFRSFRSIKDITSPEQFDRETVLKAGLRNLVCNKPDEQPSFVPKQSFAAPNYSILEIPEDEEGEEEMVAQPGNYKVSPTCVNHPLKKAKYSAVITRSIASTGELCCFCSRCAVELVKNDIRVNRLPREPLLKNSPSCSLKTATTSLLQLILEKREETVQETEFLAKMAAQIDSECSRQTINLEELQEQLIDAIRSAVQSAKQELEASTERNRSIVLGLSKKVSFCSSELNKLQQKLNSQASTQESLNSAKRDFERLSRFFETEKVRMGSVKLKRLNVHLASSLSEETERFVAQHLAGILHSETQPFNQLNCSRSPKTPFSSAPLKHCELLQSVSFDNQHNSFLPTPDNISVGKPVAWANTVNKRPNFPNSLLFRHNSLSSLTDVGRRGRENERPTRVPSHFIFPPVDLADKRVEMLK